MRRRNRNRSGRSRANASQTAQQPASQAAPQAATQAAPQAATQAAPQAATQTQIISSVQAQIVPVSQPQPPLKKREIIQKAKQIRDELRAKIREEIENRHCDSEIKEYAVAQKTIDDYFAQNKDQIPDAVLLKLRSVLYKPDALNESGKSMVVLFVLDVFFTNVVNSIIQFQFDEGTSQALRIAAGIGVSVVFVLVTFFVMLLLYNVLGGMFEHYSDKIDAYKLETVDKIIEERENKRRSDLNQPHP